MANQVFGGNAVQSAYISYLSLDIRTNDLTLVWPDAYVNVPYVNPGPPIKYYNSVAAYMNVVTSGTAHTITLPDATLTSVGQSFIFTNLGSGPFNLVRSDGSPLATINTGISLYFLLTDNTIPAGVWSMVTFGAGTSAAIAAALAGYGLIATGDNRLNTSVPVGSYSVAPTIDATFRAQLIVWTGMATTIRLPLIGSVPAGFYVSFTNQSSTSAAITIVPGTGDIAKISGESSVEVQFGQSLTIISDGTNWWTLGFGQNQKNTVTVNQLNVSGSTNIELDPDESASLLQEYIGTLTGNITVFFPIAADNWIITNNTNTGPYTLTVQLTGAVGDPWVIPQGSTQSFAADDDGMYTASASTFPLTVGNSAGLAVGNGTAAVPAITFGSTIPNAPGFYYDSLGNQISIVNGGKHLADFQVNIFDTTTDLSIIDPTNASPFIISVGSDSNVVFNYNSVDSIKISDTGIVTLPAGALPVGSGGTGATTQPAIANNVLPTAVAGNMLFYNGTNWIVVPPGTTPGQHLTWVSPTAAPTWS